MFDDIFLIACVIYEKITGYFKRSKETHND
jgi:hypothetical protein